MYFTCASILSSSFFVRFLIFIVSTRFICYDWNNEKHFKLAFHQGPNFFDAVAFSCCHCQWSPISQEPLLMWGSSINNQDKMKENLFVLSFSPSGWSRPTTSTFCWATWHLRETTSCVFWPCTMTASRHWRAPSLWAACPSVRKRNTDAVTLYETRLVCQRYIYDSFITKKAGPRVTYWTFSWLSHRNCLGL